VDDTAFLMLQGTGVDPSTLINRIIALFLKLPDDPREKLVQEQSEEIMIRLRIQYEREIRDRIMEQATKQAAQDLDRVAADQRAAELLSFGELLQKTTCWMQIHRALQDGNYDSDYWEIALMEINAADGDKWDSTRLWNNAIEWYNRFGKGGQPGAVKNAV
jgi:hypothetical protein